VFLTRCVLNWDLQHFFDASILASSFEATAVAAVWRDRHH
jgi:hypothetical protein